MATVNLLPTGDSSNDWNLPTVSDVYALLDDDHTGSIASDTSHLYSASSGSSCIVSFADLAVSYSAINIVTAVTRAGNNGRGRTFELSTRIISGGTDLYTESSGTQAASLTYRTQTYTTRTTSDGSAAWDKSDIDGLQMRIDLSSHSGGTTRFTHCYYVIDYDLPVATDNSIFFGTNF